MVVRYTHGSRIGQFSIELTPTGRWTVVIDRENLGSYHSATSALDDLVGGHTDWPSGVDPSTLSLADDLTGWESHSAS